MNENVVISNKSSEIIDEGLAPFLLTDVGTPFVIGLAVGYFAKKMLKIGLFLAGGAIILLFVSEYHGYTQINDQALMDTTEAVTNAAKQYGNFLIERLSHITSKGLSAVAGFALGLKIG